MSKKTTSPRLSLKGVQRSYRTGHKTLNVLRGVDVDLYAGELVALVGPSGCGKSSLLHAAGLLEQPNSGDVVLEGQSCLQLSETARTRIRLQHIGFVYQFHHLLPEFSALDNAALPYMIAGHSPQKARLRARELLVELGLEERLDHQPAQLSGGEQQRVALARALVNDPLVLLADEPTGNLDPSSSASVFQNLSDLARDKGVTTLVATHNLELISLMDRAFTLRDGKVEAYVI